MEPPPGAADDRGVPVVIGVVAAGIVAAIVVVVRRRAGRSGRGGLQIEELRRLHRAELAVATAPSTYAAAKELAGHTLALLDAPAAVVLIEGVGDTVRVARGEVDAHSVYAPGSRMRLLDDDGTPVGSIAVAARDNGRDYDARDEEILDALAQRVSATLRRLSLFDQVQAERGALADVLDSSSDAIFAVGADLRVQSWNPAMAAFTGITVDAAIGQPCCAVFRPVNEDGAPRHGAGCPCRSASPSEELLRITGPGGDRWLNCSFSPRSGGGAVVVARDVTARKRLDDEKADFLATVSHELRTPLTPLKGFLQTLVRRGDEVGPDERRHVYSVLLREEERLERLVDQLLRATAIDQRVAAAPVPFDWRAVVDARVDAFRRQDPDRDVEVVVPPTADGRIGMLAEPDTAATVLENLLSNVAKYTPPGTPVTVRVTVDRTHDVVETTVEDAGAGIEPADRERVFEKFTRLGDHLTRPQQGVGLGLYIVKRSTEAMGGTVRCDVSPTGGAAFVVRLPGAALAPTADPRPVSTAPPAPWGAADDELSIR
jgi:PAS domain S-box-containing protein